MAVPPEVDEFERAGVTKAPCIDAPGPRVAESPCHFKCEYLQTVRLPGNSAVGTVDMVIGRVARIHIRDNVVGPGGKLDIPKIQPIARMGYFDYTVVRETFEMHVPEATGAAAAAMQGKA